ncbi:MAG: chitobiase/beta-hexosaminidase C-terminal domain-containing protein [Flavobacteriales bacterium]
MRRLLFFISALFFIESAYSQVVVNEFCVANYTDYAISGENEDWIEFYNPTGAPIDIGGYWLSDNITNPQKFAIPAGTSVPANGYRLILMSGTFEFNPGYLGQINTNFKVTQTAGEQIVFSNPAGVVLESFDFSTLSPNQANHSYGRSSDGANDFVIFLDPTPNASNVGTTGIAYAARPQFSLEAGYYATGTTVSITTSEPGATIYYTTDGSFPTNASTLYTGPVTIDVTKVIRAIAYSPDVSILPSFIETNTFFTGADQHTVVIASVSGPTLSDGSWWGDEAMHLELFNASGNFIVEASGDSNEHGNDSNAYAQRGFDYVTRDAMGYDNEVEYPIINSRDRNGYERLIFKAAANDNYPFSNGGAHIRDAYVCELSIRGGLKLDERSTESCVVYINGQFWGVYEIREKVDDIDFTDHYYDQPEGFVDFMKTWGGNMG